MARGTVLREDSDTSATKSPIRSLRHALIVLRYSNANDKVRGMCIPLRCLLALLLVGMPGNAAAQSAPASATHPDVFPGSNWQQVSSPERAGWSKDKLLAARQYANTDSIHTSAVIVVQRGEVIDQWGDFDKKIDSYSIRKSLLSALYGIYSAEGVIDINQTLEQLGIDDSPGPLTKEESRRASWICCAHARACTTR